MKYLLCCFLLTPSFTYAQDCLKLYEAKASEIQKKDGYKTHVGGQVIIQNGQLGYWPGIEVNADIDNWAEDLVAAIKWGPYSYPQRDDDPRKAWLEAFRKEIKSDCKLPKDNYDKLRSMLKELMEDGSFCPNGEILHHTLIGGKRAFKKVLSEAVKDQRFVKICQGKDVADTNDRSKKEVEDKRQAPSEKATSSQQ